MIKYSQLVDLKNINDSMELNSGITICEYQDTEKDVSISIEVRGYVTVSHKDEVYRHASEMPEDLLTKFHDGTAYKSPDVYIEENNWYEITYTDSEDTYSDVLEEDIAGYTCCQLMEVCKHTMDDWRNYEH